MCVICGVVYWIGWLLYFFNIVRRGRYLFFGEHLPSPGSFFGETLDLPEIFINIVHNFIVDSVGVVLVDGNGVDHAVLIFIC